MSLSTKDAGGNGNGGFKHEIAKGVYADPVKVKRVLDLSGQVLEHVNKKFDLAIKVELDEGKELSFVPSVSIFGNFNREGGMDWGGAFKVGAFFKSIGVLGDLTANYKIPKEWLSEAVGKPVMKVTFAAGVKTKDPSKVNWYSYDMLYGLADTTEAEVVELIKDEWARQRQKGYPKSYDASGVKSRNGQPTTSDPFENGDTRMPNPEMATAAAYVEAGDDDDIPF